MSKYLNGNNSIVCYEYRRLCISRLRKINFFEYPQRLFFRSLCFFFQSITDLRSCRSKYTFRTFSTSPGTFYNVDKANCTLYVPVGSKVFYQNTDQWKDFQNIIEGTTAVLSDIKVSDIKIHCNNNILQIEVYPKTKQSLFIMKSAPYKVNI